jgi:uncharacterized repeat protein (TIGR01451 family)
VRIWYPFSAFYTVGCQNDPATPGCNAGVWDGSTVIPGSYPVTNCVAEFDPASADGTTTNYGNGLEPGWDGSTASGNNCRVHTVPITLPGAFWARYAGTTNLYGSNDLFGAYPQANWPCSGDPDEFIVPGQTACDTADGPVVAGQRFTSSINWSAQKATSDLGISRLCEVIDNSVYRLAPIPNVGNGLAAGLYGWAEYFDSSEPYINGVRGGIDGKDLGFVYEFARFTAASGRKTWQVDHSGAPDAITNYYTATHDQMNAAASDCGEVLTTNGELEWTTDQNAFSADEIVMIRIRNDDPNLKINYGDYMDLVANFEVRETYYAPDYPLEDGQPILPGVQLINVSNWIADRDGDGTNESGTADYNVNTHRGGAVTSAEYGDRLVYQTVNVAIDKQAYKAFDGSTVGDDDLLEEFAGDPIMWSLHPSVSSISNDTVAEDVTITDVLPQYTSYSAACSPPLPAGISGPQIFPNTPNAGETTLIYTYDNDLPANVALEPISICTNTDAFAPAPVDVVNDVKIEASNTVYIAALQENERAVRLLQVGRFAVNKAVDFPLDFQEQDQVWTMTWANTSEFIPFVAPDIIDVLPYSTAQYPPGDGPGALAERELYASDYAGSLALQTIPVAPGVTGDGGSSRTDNGQWYATCDDPNTVNPDASNTAYNDLGTGSTNWIAVTNGSATNPSGTCALSDVTAIRWVSSDVLGALETATIDFTVQAASNDPNDLYVNRFTAYSATFLDTPVRSNEPIVQVVGFSLGDLIWLDLNDNGTFDDGIDATAPSGVTVNLYDATDTLVDTTTTDANGRWFFEALIGGQYTSGGTYVAGEYYVTVSGLPNGWIVPTTSEVDPNTDNNEDSDHHTIDDNGTIRSAGLMQLSASIDASGEITGDEPTGDNIEFLGDPLIRDDLTNFTLDLMLIPARGDIEVTKTVTDSSSVEGWQFALTSDNVSGCPLPAGLTNPANTDASGKVRFDGLLVNSTENATPCTYSLTEMLPATYKQTDQTPAGSISVTDGNTTAVSVTNAPKVGNLQITKQVTGGTDTQSFTLQLDCSDDSFDNNNIQLTAGQTHTVNDIPEGTTCSVTETVPTPPAGYAYRPAAITPDQPISIYDGVTAYVTVTNTLLPVCTMTASANALACVDPGTPADSSDDYYQFELVVNASNTGASTGYNFNSNDPAVMGYNLPYGTETLGPYVIEATASPLTLNLVDTLDANCTATVTNLTEPATCSPGLPDLTISKVASQSSVVTGDTFTYTLQASNLSTTVAASNVRVDDTLPGGVTYVSQSGDGTYDQNTGIWAIGNLPAGESRSITLTVQAN